MITNNYFLIIKKTNAPIRLNKNGFTLLELAIVLVIIGILFLVVIKGQELIYNAKVKSLAQDFKQLPILIYGYQDRFRALPGDDLNVTNNLAGATLATCTPTCLGNGKIDGFWNSSTVTDESLLFWQHVRLAGFASGVTNTSNLQEYQAKNVEGGKIGIEAVSSNFISEMSGSYLMCSAAILGKLAKQLDITLDDGKRNTGAMRIVEDSHVRGNAAATDAVDDSARYLVCMGF